MEGYVEDRLPQGGNHGPLASVLYADCDNSSHCSGVAFVDTAHTGVGMVLDLRMKN